MTWSPPRFRSASSPFAPVPSPQTRSASRRTADHRIIAAQWDIAGGVTATSAAVPAPTRTGGDWTATATATLSCTADGTAAATVTAGRQPAADTHTAAIDVNCVRLACAEHLGTLAAGRITRSGTVTADTACVSSYRSPGSHYVRRHTFTLDSPAWIDVDLAKTTANSLDPYVLLIAGHDNTGAALEQDDNSGVGNSSRLTDVFLQPGDYAMEVTGTAAGTTGATGDYTLTVDATVTGLRASYDAIVDEELTIGFDTGDYVARLRTVTPPTLDWSAGRSGGRSSLAVTAGLADTHRVVMTLTKPSSGAESQARSVSATTASPAVAVVEFDITAACRTGLAASARNGHLCVPTASQTPSTNYPEDRITETGRGPKHPVTLGTLWGVKRVTKDARDAYMNPSPGVTRDCTPTADRLAAIMLAVPLWEVPRTWWIDHNKDNRIQPDDEIYTQRDPGRSPMALSRKDYRDLVLYSNNNKSSPKRAFWHPGVGLWQLDDPWWNIEENRPYAANINHAERADIHVGGQIVADYLVELLCPVTEANMETKIKQALSGPWNACRKASHPCYRSYIKLWVKGTDDLHVTTHSTEYREYNGTLQGGNPVERDHRSEYSTSGGLSKLKRRWGTSATEFDCWFYDTDNPEGWMPGKEETAEQKKGSSAWSPLAAPFMSFTFEGKRYAVFPRSYTGSRSTLIKAVPGAMNVRKAGNSTWTEDRNGQILQAEICRVIAVEAGGVCEWVSTTLNTSFRGQSVSFKSKIRDAGH